LYCVGGTTNCNDICTNTNLDPANCGACDVACIDGEVCSMGSCSLSCVGGTTECGGVCVDTAIDSNHCGVCNKACLNGEICTNGSCGLVCAGGTTNCGGYCVNTANDSNHCGACNNACPQGEVCSSSSCGLSCVGGTSNCGGVCVDTTYDPANCGACNQICASNQACVKSACVPLQLTYCNSFNLSGFTCPTNATQFCDAKPISATDAAQAKAACETCYGTPCYIETADCAGSGYGPNPKGSYVCGDAYFGYQSGCSGVAGRIWSICSSNTTYGIWAP